MRVPGGDAVPARLRRGAAGRRRRRDRERLAGAVRRRVRRRAAPATSRSTATDGVRRRRARPGDRREHRRGGSPRTGAGSTFPAGRRRRRASGRPFPGARDRRGRLEVGVPPPGRAPHDPARRVAAPAARQSGTVDPRLAAAVRRRRSGADGRPSSTGACASSSPTSTSRTRSGSPRGEPCSPCPAGATVVRSAAPGAETVAALEDWGFDAEAAAAWQRLPARGPTPGRAPCAATPATWADVDRARDRRRRPRAAARAPQPARARAPTTGSSTICAELPDAWRGPRPRGARRPDAPRPGVVRGALARRPAGAAVGRAGRRRAARARARPRRGRRPSRAGEALLAPGRGPGVTPEELAGARPLRPVRARRGGTARAAAALARARRRRSPRSGRRSPSAGCTPSPRVWVVEGGVERLTLDEAAARAGIDPSTSARRVWRALGFVDPGRGERPCSERDVEVFRVFELLERDDVAGARAADRAGHGFRAGERRRRRGRGSPQRGRRRRCAPAAAATSTSRATSCGRRKDFMPLLAPVLDTVHRHHVAAAGRRYALWGVPPTRGEHDRRGRRVRRPRRLHRAVVGRGPRPSSTCSWSSSSASSSDVLARPECPARQAHRRRGDVRGRRRRRGGRRSPARSSSACAGAKVSRRSGSGSRPARCSSAKETCSARSSTWRRVSSGPPAPARSCVDARSGAAASDRPARRAPSGRARSRASTSRSSVYALGA